MNKPDLKVVPIREGSPCPLNDIAGKLRELAERIESGQEGPFNSVFVIGIYSEEFTPWFGCFGDNPDRHTTSGILLHTAQMALTNRDD